MSRVSAFVAKRFGVDSAKLIVFEVWPRREDRNPNVKRVTFADDGRGKASRRALALRTLPSAQP